MFLKSAGWVEEEANKTEPSYEKNVANWQQDICIKGLSSFRIILWKISVVVHCCE